MIDGLDRDQVLFVREFFIQGRPSICIKPDDKKLFVDSLEEKGVVAMEWASKGKFGHPSLLGYKLDCHAKNFIQNNMDIIFEGLPSDSEEIAKQRPQYLVEGQRLGQIR